MWQSTAHDGTQNDSLHRWTMLFILWNQRKMTATLPCNFQQASFLKFDQLFDPSKEHCLYDMHSSDKSDVLHKCTMLWVTRLSLSCNDLQTCVILHVHCMITDTILAESNGVRIFLSSKITDGSVLMCCSGGRVLKKAVSMFEDCLWAH